MFIALGISRCAIVIYSQKQECTCLIMPKNIMAAISYGMLMSILSSLFTSSTAISNREAQYFSFSCGINAIPNINSDIIINNSENLIACASVCSSSSSCQGFAYLQVDFKCHLYFAATVDCTFSESTFYSTKVDDNSNL